MSPSGRPPDAERLFGIPCTDNEFVLITAREALGGSPLGAEGGAGGPLWLLRERIGGRVL